MRPTSRRAWLLGVSLLLSSSVGCKPQSTELESAPDTAHIQQTEDVTPDEPAAIALPTLTELARLDADGYLFGVAIDALGNVMVTTLRGRKAVYVVTPEQDLHSAPIALEVDGFVSFPFAVGRGLFAAPLPSAKTVELIRVDLSAPQPALKRVGSIKTAGVPAQVIEAFGLLWLSQRHDPDGIGLQAIEPSSGEVLASIPTPEGEVPIELTRLTVNTKETVYLTTRGADGLSGHVMTILGADLKATPPSLIEIGGGAPMKVFSLDGEATEHPLVLRYETPVVSELLAPLTTVSLPFPAHTIATTEHGVFFTANPAGEIARVAREDDGGGATLQRVGEPGVVALIVVDSMLFMLNTKTRMLSMHSQADLEELTSVRFDSEPGRMVIDRARRRVYVTLPELQQIAVVGYTL